MIEVMVATAGGVGTSSIAKSRAEMRKALLIEASNRTRVQDLLAKEDGLNVIDDYYDFLRGSGEASIIHLLDYDLIQGTIFHDLEEIDEARFQEALATVADREIVVDLSRHRETDLIYWAKASDRMYLISDGSRPSLRNMERVRFILLKHRLNPEIIPVFNRLKEGDRERIDSTRDLSLEEAIYIDESPAPRLDLRGDEVKSENDVSKKRRFWDFFKS